MNWKVTLGLLVLAAALIAFLEFYEDKQPGTRDLEATADRVFVLDRNQVDGLIITSHDLKVDLRREGTHWVMKSPIADRADQPAVDAVLNGLESMRKEETLPFKELDSKTLQDYGLQNPKAQLEVVAHGLAKPTSLYFGNDAAVEGKTYLQLGGKDGNVLVVGDELKKDLQKDVNSWRDHRLTDTAATDVNKLTIKNATGDIELQRQRDHWQIDKPLAARANDQKVNDLVSQITNLTIDGFVADDKANAAAYGLAEPRGVVTFYTAANPKGSELLIGGVPQPASKPAAAGGVGATPAPVASESVYLRLPARQSIYTVPKSVEDFLTVKPNDLRDRSLVRLNPDMVDRIKITPASGAPFTLARKDKNWTLQGAPANAAEADGLMRQLSAANVTSFAADSAGDLVKYGLDHPALQVTFSSFASENTAETNAGDKPIATVSFGKTDGADVYARVEEEPFVVSTPKTVFDAIPADPLQWQPLDIFQIEPGKIGALEEQGKDRPEMSAGSKAGGWVLQKGAGPLDESKTESVINTLARLHAVRWVGANKAEYGLDDPALTVTFATGADAKSRTTLRLGARNGEQMEYARVDGKDGVFLISRPDADTLQQPLTPVPEPTPSPAPAATPSPTPVATVAPAPSPVESTTPPPSPVSQ